MKCLLRQRTQNRPRPGFWLSCTPGSTSSPDWLSRDVAMDISSSFKAPAVTRWRSRSFLSPASSQLV